jgi:hypothetical protein
MSSALADNLLSADRPRPGRAKTVSSELIPLFRHPTERPRSDLRTSYAITIAILISLPMWAVIAVAALLIFS